MHKQQRQHWQRLQPRDAAARRIQRTFRGWRTRLRIVYRVREDMDLLVGDIQHQLNGEWALLGPAAATLSSFSLDWGRDGTLRLPRMEDSLFGVSVHFPSVESEEEQHDDDDDESKASANEYEQGASLDSGLMATNGPESQDKATPFESSIDRTSENRPPADDTQGIGAQASQGASAEAANSSDAASSCDARVSAVEIRGTTLQAETSASCAKQQLERQTESMDGAPLQGGKDGNTQLASVQEILASHSRAEILLELEWARQALRDRRKYLRSKRRVERGPDPCACA
ncbi:hypothetical protein JG687_00003520 [Phytophthora cactorum]|uniref:IQ motif, EF-hand binding site n=1 Tax=Phytophthora cactorum TaxID=29920 RepID=A0A8T1UW01_9STRA|nr:IQ motif, EF-hand binding site [Phytophthora cactorum]KAG3034901.1 hypothetical protein PC120_g1146 [Phytophthora cactorum]KAG3098475.1 hypothetical protein PC121_g2054 [Phytophthora cactorum]KAG3206959.1 hypothetical protein PC128_g429 [Phytophthora cactorum]KAG4063536.1 hypothetical protein PC123_g1604 [Phytophthora cactorum]